MQNNIVAFFKWVQWKQLLAKLRKWSFPKKGNAIFRIATIENNIAKVIIFKNECSKDIWATYGRNYQQTDFFVLQSK